MIHIASRLLSDRWTKIHLALASVVVVMAFAMQPPAKPRVVVTDTHIEILEEVTFVGNTISTRSLRTLDAMAATLVGNPSITLVEIQANTLENAEACTDYMIGQGVEPARMILGLNNDGRPRAAFMILTRSSDE